MLEVNVVLFVCSGNFYRSRFAEALFNHRALREALRWRAESRGFSPHFATADLAPEAQRALELRHIPLALTRRKPARLEENDLSRASRIVCVNEIEHRPKMEQSHPEWADRIIYWDIHDVQVEPPGTALPQLEQNVLDLMEQLTAESPRTREASARSLEYEF